MRSLLALVSALALLGSPGMARAELSLLMAEAAGCYWCERWDAEIAEIYPRSPEGQLAPLRRIDIHRPLPTDLRIDRPLLFTPTFVLLDDGQELGRIEGYPGADFFWGLLGVLLKEHGFSTETSGEAGEIPVNKGTF